MMTTCVCVCQCSVVNLRLGDPEAALQPLKKLHTLLPDQPEVSTVSTFDCTVSMPILSVSAALRCRLHSMHSSWAVDSIHANQARAEHVCVRRWCTAWRWLPTCLVTALLPSAGWRC
jgi:hypothetical protein